MDAFWVTFIIPQNEIRRFKIRRNGTEPVQLQCRQYCISDFTFELIFAIIFSPIMSKSRQKVIVHIIP